MNVIKIIESALKQLGVLAAGENAEANELVDAVDALRWMIAQWATQRLYVYKSEAITLTLNGVATVSPNIEDSPDYLAQISKVIEQASLDGEAIYLVRDTNTTKPSKYITYRVNGDVYEFTGNGSLEFKALTLPSALNPTDDLILPSEYERPLILSLAVEIAPMFGVEPTQALVMNQRQSIEMLKRSNSTPFYVQNDLPVGVGYYGCD